MLNNILQPELNNNLLKRYHMSGKLLIPLIIPSIIFKKYEVNPYLESGFDIANILNVGYHSYVSTSCIITDYIKPKNLSSFVRLVNLNSHGIAIGGLLYYVYNKKFKN